MSDTRKLFSKEISRKPFDWSQVKILKMDDNDERFRILLSKPLVSFNNWNSPFHIHNTFREIGKKKDENYFEFLLLRLRNTAPPSRGTPLEDFAELFYVNTEGYEYGRYMARIPDEYAKKILTCKLLEDISQSLMK
jgi:hypothetical protein